MNRQEEYEALRHELSAPALAAEHTFARAHVRNQRRMRVVRPLAGLASAFACFVLLVNISTPVAAACARVPYLRELADAVSFSRSLADAVRHSYAQPVNLEQTDGDITAKVEYLIVDQKQVNVFFRIESERYETLSVEPGVRTADGAYPESCGYMLNEHDVPNGKLQSITVDFIERDVPDKLQLRLALRPSGDALADRSIWSSDEKDNPPPAPITQFEFLLTFDPNDMERGRHTEIGKTVELDGQIFTLTDMEVYPTHLRLNVEDEPSNTKWLKRLDFYLVVNGRRWRDKGGNGISATGKTDSPMMRSYRKDSIYFYDAKSIDVVITGAEWVDKEMEKIRVDLSAGTADRMPEGAELWSVEKKDGSYTITVRAMMRAPNSHHQIFNSIYYDTAGVEYDFNLWSSSSYAEPGQTESKYFYVTFGIEDYPYTEVWLTPSYSSEWVAPTPITVNIK